MTTAVSSPEVVVFYAGQIYEEHPFLEGLYASRVTIPQEIYNGAYVWLRPTSQWKYLGDWTRMDGTPVLLQNVPPALRAWVLIL